MEGKENWVTRLTLSEVISFFFVCVMEIRRTSTFALSVGEVFSLAQHANFVIISYAIGIELEFIKAALISSGPFVMQYN